MSFPFEKQPGEKQENTMQPSDDLTDWERFEAMDDEDILFDADNPEIRPGDLEHGVIRISDRVPTKEEIADAKRQILAYINRPRQSK